jgi:putative endonuclease
MSSGRLTRLALRALDSAARLAPKPKKAEHLILGERGEEEAYFYLRRRGYIMVARNFRSSRRRGEIDLIGWEGDILCFVEVKTRTSHAVKPAEAAVDEDKQRELIAVARDYLRRVPGKPAIRFDVLSIYLEKRARSPEITLFRNAFSMP